MQNQKWGMALVFALAVALSFAVAAFSQEKKSSAAAKAPH
jgi:hypothetical protein